MVLASDAVVSDLGDVVGDPTEAALVVLAARLGVSAEETRRAYPRVAEIPFDSSYKFMSTLHWVTIEGQDRLVMLTKGGPDVVLRRCTGAASADGIRVPIDQARSDIEAANARLGSEGLRVLAFAARLIPVHEEQAAIEDPMAFVEDLRFEALTGIIDPLRPSSKHAVAIAKWARRRRRAGS